MNSGEDETIPVTVSGHGPLLLSVSGSSRNELTHTSPNAPALAIERASRGAGALPLTRTTLGLDGSLLVIVSVADAGPRVRGSNRTGSSTESPAPIAIG